VPSETLEEYLETIYKLSEKGEVRPMQIAEALGVSAPTVTATLGRLEKGGLIRRPHTGVALTREGTAQAISIIRRHRLAEVFLHDVLQLPWDVVHEEACKLEHALSPDVAVALERFLEDPQRCPHGHVIPRADGSMPDETGIALSEATPGSTYIVSRVDDEEDEEFLTYIGGLGLYPGTRVRVTEVAPYDGPITVMVGDAPCAVGRQAASQIRVTAA
jgi:DtxR family transcriptional regulator, Mn-dependent transcriptional regulator